MSRRINCVTNVKYVFLFKLH